MPASSYLKYNAIYLKRDIQFKILWNLLIILNENISCFEQCEKLSCEDVIVQFCSGLDRFCSPSNSMRRTPPHPVASSSRFCFKSCQSSWVCRASIHASKTSKYISTYRVSCGNNSTPNSKMSKDEYIDHAMINRGPIPASRAS